MTSHATIPLFPKPDNGLLSGTVQGGQAPDFMVQTPHGLLTATVAVSCLLKPLAGDRVLLAKDEQAYFILAVLTRAPGQNSTVELPADSTLHCPHGRLSLAAVEGIDVLGGQGITLYGQKLHMQGKQVNVDAAELALLGKRASLHAQSVSLQAETMSSVVGQVIQRFKSCCRWVEQAEIVNTGELLHKVRRLFSLRARQATLTAESDVKIDAKRIHMG